MKLHLTKTQTDDFLTKAFGGCERLAMPRGCYFKTGRVPKVGRKRAGGADIQCPDCGRLIVAKGKERA